MFKRILILVGVVTFSLVLALGLVRLTIGTAPAVRAAPNLPSACTQVVFDIFTHTTWSDYCYRVMTSTVTVQPDVILTISPITSTRVEFESGAYLVVLGRLQALGAPSRPITFTSAALTTPCSWNGIVLPFGSQGARIEHSIIEYACAGITIGGIQSVQIVSNVFRYNGDGGSTGGAISGITDYSVITGNVIYSSTNGIVLNKAFSNQIVGNTIRDIQQYGINFTAQLTTGLPTVGGDDNVIANNSISNALAGLRLEIGSYNQVLSNSISMNRGGAAYLLVQDQAIVRYNRIYSNGEGLRLETGSSNQVLSNSIYLNTGSAIYLSGQGSPVVQSNHVFSNGGGADYRAAIYITDTPGMATTIVSYNTVHDERQDALEYTANNNGIGSWAWNNALCSVPSLELRNDDDLTTDARYNWWGTNTPTPGQEYLGAINLSPWITLSLITTTAALPADGTSTSVITISLRDALGNTAPPASPHSTNPPAPNARRIGLATSLGVINPSVVVVNDSGFAVATLTSAPTAGTAIITATAFCNYPITIPVRFLATNLAITKTVAVSQVVAGGVLTYSITYSNTSGVLASDVRITDTLPAGTTWLDDNAVALGWARIQTSPQVVYTRAGLSPGARESFILTATVSSATCGASLINGVAIGTRMVEENYSDNTASAGPVQVICTDVTITKTTLLTQAVPGNWITYTIVYSNVSNAAAYGVVITDVLPAGARYVADTSGLPCPACTPGATGPLVWSVGTLLPGSSRSFNLTLQVDRSSSLCGASLINSVSISTSTPESNLANNSGQARPLPLVCADVTITKTTALTQAVPGNWITYTIVYSNVSSVPAYGVVITDVLPSGTRYVADTSGLPCPACVPGSTGPLVWSVPTPMPPNSSYSFNLTLQADRDSALCGTSLVNRVSISTITPESNLANNGGQTGPLPLVCADVTITKTTALTQAVPGNWITYTIVYSNVSSVPAYGVVITDVLPSGTRYVADTSGLSCPACVPGAIGPLAWSVATPLPPNASYSFNLTLAVDRNSALCGTSLVNGVSISTITPESNLANNSGQARPLPLVCTDVEITKTTSITRTVAGGLITYTIVYSNVSSATASGVLITDVLPLGTRYVANTSGLPCPACVSGATGPLTWSVGTLPPGSPRSFNLTLQVEISADNCNLLVPPNTVVITTTTPESNTANNTAASPSVASVCPVDLVVLKDDDVGPTTPLGRPAAVENFLREASKNDPMSVTQHRDFVYEGDLITYTIAVINVGTVTATNVILTETLPQYTSFVTGSGWVAVTPITYVLSIGSLPPGAGRIYYFVVRVNDPLPAGVSRLINQVCGFAAESDGNPDDNCAYEDTPVRRLLLRVSKWAQCIVPGQAFSYWILYTNTATTTYSSVRITDTLPISTTYAGAVGDWTCPGNVYCSWIAPAIYPGTGVKELPVRLDQNYPYATVTNTVVISDGPPFTLVSPVDRGLDLAVVKNDNIGPLPRAQQQAWEQIQRQLYGWAEVSPAQAEREYAQPGERITYTILYVNNGVVTATNVVLTETLPAQTTYVGGGWTFAGGRFYTVSLGTLGPRQGGQLEFILRVNDPFYCGDNRVVNRVDIGGAGSECDLGDNWSADHTPITGCTPIKVYLPIILRQEQVLPLVQVAFSSANYRVWETMGVATITVVLNGSSAQTVTVDYSTANGTAVAGLDYIAATGTLTFPPGTTSRTFAVRILTDTLTESPETVILTLARAVNAALGQPNPATLTIYDPCPPTPPSCAPAVWCVMPSEFGPMGMAYDSAAGRLFVANQGDASNVGNLTILNNSGELIHVLGNLSNAQGVALDKTRGRNRAYVAGGNWLYVVNVSGTASSVLATIDVGVGEDVGAYSVAYNPNSDLIYVTGYNDDSVTVVNAGSLSVVRRLTGFFQPSYTAVNTATNKVYVSNHTGGVPWGFVSVLSGTTKLATVYLSGDLYGVTVDAVRNRIYVASISVARVYVIDGKTDTTMGDIQIIRARDSRPVPLRQVAVNPSVGADTHLWLTSSRGDFWGMDRLILLSLPQSTWPAQAPLVLRATAIEPSPEGGLVFDPNPASWRVFASSAVSNLVTLSRDNATLCPDPLYASMSAQDSYRVVTHDYTFRRRNR